MFDAKKLLDQVLGSAGDLQKKANANPALSGLAGGALAGTVMGVLLGSNKGRKLAGSALKIGGLAAIGGLAYKAWSDWQAQQQGQGGTETQPPMKDVTPAKEGSAFLPAPQAEQNQLAEAVLRAMIAAAKADGHIDAEEQKRIFASIDKMELDRDAKAFVMDELRAPLDVDAVVKGASSPEQAAEIYAASFLAIDPDHPAEKAYLQMLAARLGLDPGLIGKLEQEVTAARTGSTNPS